MSDTQQSTPRTLSRRNFLKTSATASGALLIGFSLPSGSYGKSSRQKDNWQPNAWLELDKNGQLTFILDRVEMGQGTMTGLTTLIAEELNTSPEAIGTRFAPANRKYRNPDFGLQMTGGSTSMSTSWKRIRKAAAAMAKLLVSSAADIWNVSWRECTIGDGMVSHPQKGSLPWAKLIPVAIKEKLPRRVKLKPASEFRYIGQRNLRTDSQVKVHGLADYGIDTQLPNMVYSTVIHSPYVGGTLKNLDDQQARQAAGVIDIIPIRTGVAVVAKRYWQARKAAELVTAQWHPGPAGTLSTDDVFTLYKKELDRDKAKVIRKKGRLKRAARRATKTITAEYQAPFLAHATMEPQNCVAHVTDQGVEVWAPTQAPDMAQVAAARVTDFSPSDVTVHTTFLGGGFGRRIVQDFVGEAVEIANKVRLPVKLVWSREDDTRNDYFRPAALHRMTGSLDDEGQPQLWHHRIACPTLMDWIINDAAPAQFAMMPKWSHGSLADIGLATQGSLAPSDYSPYEGADTMAYQFPAIKLDYAKANPQIPVTYWRSVGNSHNAFVIESFIDELAHAAGESPLSFRQRQLKKSPRALQVLNTAAEKARWGQLPPGRFHGIGFHFSFNTWVAQIAEISVSSTDFKVEKVTCVVDCGTVVNPDIVRAQMESGIIYGLTAALHGEITFKEGQVQQSNFHDYPALRINEIPEIDVYLTDSDEPPTGVGEPGLPPIAPAVANAVFAATGQRLRKLPLKLA